MLVGLVALLMLLVHGMRRGRRRCRQQPRVVRRGGGHHAGRRVLLVVSYVQRTGRALAHADAREVARKVAYTAVVRVVVVRRRVVGVVPGVLSSNFQFRRTDPAAALDGVPVWP
jgi:hypothetical protein